MRINLTLTVNRKEYITPSYLRIFLGGEGVEKFAVPTVGDNNKIMVPPAGVSKVQLQEFDYKSLDWKPMAEEEKPVVRTLTHRGIDLEKKELWLDFVVHGDEGRASAWAKAAKPGDELHVMMKNRADQLYGEADNYLLVGDNSAIPVLGAILEDLPETAKGTCIIEVFGKEHEQTLPTKANIEFKWLHNPEPQKGSKLADVVEALDLPKENKFGYVAAELNTVKRLRTYLRKNMGWQRDELYAFSFWKAGMAEDRSKPERNDEKNKVEELRTINSI